MNGPRGGKLARAGAWLDRVDSRRAGLVGLLLAMAVSVGLLLWLMRDALFASDEWSWLSISSNGSFSDLLRPINQHEVVVSMLVFKASLALWGLDTLPFKLAEIAGVVACSALAYVFSRRRLGPILALAPAMVPLFFGTATSIMLQPLIGLQVIYAVAFGLAALVLAERGGRAADAAACVCACLAAMTFSSGLAFVAGLAVLVLLDEERWRRAYVFLVPIVLYLGVRVWALQFGTSGSPTAGNVPILPFYYVDSFAAAATALFGRESSIVGHGPATALFLEGVSLEAAAAALVFLTFEVLLVVYAARRLAARRPVPPTLWSTLTVLITLWTLQGLVLTAARTPGENRYLYATAIVLVLLAVEAARGVRLSRIGVAAVLAVAAVGVIGNLPRFREGRQGIALMVPRAHAYTEVMELAGRNADQEFNPAVNAPEVAPFGVLWFSVGQYLELAERYGSLAYTPAQLLGQSEEVRYGSDVIAVDILHLGPKPVARLPRAGCVKEPAGPQGELVSLPRGGAVIEADGDTRLAIRRWAERAVVPLGSISAGRPAEIRIPADAAGRPWELWARDQVRLTVCRIPAAGS